MFSGYQVHLKQHHQLLHLFQTAKLSCKAILLSSTLLKNTFYIFSSCYSKNLRNKLVLIRNVKPLEIVLDDRAAREISNARGCCYRSTTKMLLLLVAAGGATCKMNLISIEHLNCFIKFYIFYRYQANNLPIAGYKRWVDRLAVLIYLHERSRGCTSLANVVYSQNLINN